jgi:hypothetical protein
MYRTHSRSGLGDEPLTKEPEPHEMGQLKWALVYETPKTISMYEAGFKDE